MSTTNSFQKDALDALFKASSELRFAIKAMNLPQVEANPSWERHTQAMKTAETALKLIEDLGFYCGEHKYNPPVGGGFAVCPKCEGTGDSGGIGFHPDLSKCGACNGTGRKLT